MLRNNDLTGGYLYVIYRLKLVQKGRPHILFTSSIGETFVIPVLTIGLGNWTFYYYREPFPVVPLISLTSIV